jgi:hypothetical protein
VTGDVTCTRHISLALVLTVTACGGAVMSGSDGAGGAGGGTTPVEAGPDASTCGVVRASDHDRSCTVAADCDLVWEGDSCTAECACPNATINRTAMAAYHLPASFPRQNHGCFCVLPGLIGCVGGICTICEPPGCPAEPRDSGGSGGATPVDAGRDAPACGMIRASDFDRSCKVSSDCEAIVEGDTCAMQCDCVNAAISKTALDQYMSVFVPAPHVCSCVMFGLPQCLSGVCVL